MAIHSMECEEFSDYLLAKGLGEDVVWNIVGNRIDGLLFTGLSEDEIKELAPAIGDRICLRKILDEEWKVTKRVIIKATFSVYFAEKH